MPGTCRRAFVIGIDGARGEAFREASTPNIHRVLSEGVVTYSARTAFPSASFEAWGAMFRGVEADKHKLPGETPPDETVPWPSFLKVARCERPGIRCAAFCCWGPINTHVIEASCRCHCVSMPDAELAPAAAEYIRAERPDIFFMQLDFVDHAGHRHGYRTQEYLDQISVTDGHAGVVLDAVRDAGLFDDSLIVLVSDHGGFDHSHGSDHPDCMNILWGCRGPGIRRGVELEGAVHIMDTAAVVARALGLPAPAGWDARVPEGVFEDAEPT